MIEILKARLRGNWDEVWNLATTIDYSRFREYRKLLRFWRGLLFMLIVLNMRRARDLIS